MGICTEIDVVGTSSQSWERAAAAAVQSAAASFADRCLIRRSGESGPPKPTFKAEIVSLDMKIGDDGEISEYRAKVKITFVQKAESATLLQARRAATR